MKTAVCLMGLSCGYNDKGNVIKFDKSYDSIKRNIIEINNADVFYHTWTTNDKYIDKAEHENRLRDLYNPINYKCEDQIIFSDDRSKTHQIKSRWYSHKQSISLLANHERKNNFEYDWVFVTRFDCEYYRSIEFNTLNNKKFYISNWRYPHNIKGFLDYWFLSNSKNIKKYSLIYDKLNDQYIEDNKKSNHMIAKSYALESGFDLEYILNEHRDFKLSERNY
tara:strand:+ start:7832 stop:8497 length:666 start_codon:yes stop_codon:yes gene_type:complete